MMSDSRIALLLMDFQVGIGEQARDVGAVASAALARNAAQELGILTIFVKVGFDEAFSEVGEHTPVFSLARQHARYSGATSRLIDEFIPRANEPVIDKKRFSAFSGSALDVILRCRDVRSLVLAGVSTSGVVLSTLRQAFDLDYKMTVLSDACMDPDPMIHDVLIKKVFPRQSEVITAGQWVATFGVET